jgi:hypothetical protein
MKFSNSKDFDTGRADAAALLSFGRAKGGDETGSEGSVKTAAESQYLRSSDAFMISRCAMNCVIVGAGLVDRKSLACAAPIRQ